MISICWNRARASYFGKNRISAFCVNSISSIDEIKVWIYAVENETTPINKDVDFISSLVQISDSVNYINVGGVTINTANSSIEVFITERQNISILSSISSLRGA